MCLTCTNSLTVARLAPAPPDPAPDPAMGRGARRPVITTSVRGLWASSGWRGAGMPSNRPLTRASSELGSRGRCAWARENTYGDGVYTKCEETLTIVGCSNNSMILSCARTRSPDISTPGLVRSEVQYSARHSSSTSTSFVLITSSSELTFGFRRHTLSRNTSSSPMGRTSCRPRCRSSLRT
uniref:Uncharacterized protein n=1 Tax=Human herpesvirus 1 TaxID=10298 RepID=A0A2Z4H7Y4_HHV1|nr:hypothetical protein [Human alphaherpesvirus 1]